ncbi:copia-type polyprotein [Tanacetum coccineum]
MLENGPWLIHNVPLILRKWANVSKKDLKSVPVWVKHHDVPITSFIEDGLSVTATKLVTPLMLDTYTASINALIRRVFGYLLDQCPKKTVADVNVNTQSQVVKGLHVGPKSRLVYRSIQTTTIKKMDHRQAKHKDINFNKVNSINNSGSKSMVDVASSSGKKIMTSNPFDVLNMVEKNIVVAPSDSVNSKGDDVNVRTSKDVNMDNEDNDSDNDVKEDDDETATFMTSKSSKGTGSLKSGVGKRSKCLYERWKDDYDDNSYDDDEECEDLTEEQ